MLYCFVDKDIDSLEERDPLMLQYNYAKHIGKCLIINSACQNVQEISTTGNAEEKIWLRATCENARYGQQIIEKNGRRIIETENEIRKIEHWERLNITKRKIYSCMLSDVKSLPMFILQNISKYANCFIKTRKKGMCAIIPTSKLLNGDVSLEKIQSICNQDEILISEYLDVKKDSLGKRETRFFVLNGKILNASRMVRSIKHFVIPSHYIFAQEIVYRISQKEAFPQNYVLDIGEFISNGQKMLDVVELNPITTFMCYVNNSIFDLYTREISPYPEGVDFGSEFCLDALQHPDDYMDVRISNREYQYWREDIFDFRGVQ